MLIDIYFVIYIHFYHTRFWYNIGLQLHRMMSVREQKFRVNNLMKLSVLLRYEMNVITFIRKHMCYVYAYEYKVCIGYKVQTCIILTFCRLTSSESINGDTWIASWSAWSAGTTMSKPYRISERKKRKHRYVIRKMSIKYQS